MIWCVEDDASIRDIEIYALNSTGYKTRAFEDGLSVLEALETETPDLIILDVMLPKLDGIELLKRLKSSIKYNNIPIIIASAKGQEYDRIIGLDLGADDYIVKPFSIMEMLSRVKAVLRRVSSQQNTNILQYDDLIMNTVERTVSINSNKISLTYKEYELLKLFLSNLNVVFSRDQLFEEIWKEKYIEDSRTLDAHIRSLRNKLGDYGNNIETIRNVGYCLKKENHEK